MTLNDCTVLYCTNDASFAAPHGHLKEDTSLLSAAEIARGTLF